MKMFGSRKITMDGHVIVAVVRAAWVHLCEATPDQYETVEPRPQPSKEAIVWNHDRSQVTCPECLAVLDGAVVTKVPVKL